MSLIHFKKEEKVGIITLNHSEALNVLSEALIQEIKLILETCTSDPEIHCVILRGSEKVFSAGADLKEMHGKTFEDVHKHDFIKDWESISRFPKPIIAAVSGYALGGGCEIAMMCDFIMASDTAKFGQPEVTIGIMPGSGGTQRLSRTIGKAKAMELCLTGRIIDAEEAEKIGLVSHVIPLKQWEEETFKIAQKIASYSLPILMMIKESVTRAFETPLSEGLQFERQLFHSTFKLEDRKEGMTAFLEKRAPVFKDR